MSFFFRVSQHNGGLSLPAMLFTLSSVYSCAITFVNHSCKRLKTLPLCDKSVNDGNDWPANQSKRKIETKPNCYASAYTHTNKHKRHFVNRVSYFCQRHVSLTWNIYAFAVQQIELDVIHRCFWCRHHVCWMNRIHFESIRHRFFTERTLIVTPNFPVRLDENRKPRTSISTCHTMNWVILFFLIRLSFAMRRKWIE